MVRYAAVVVSLSTLLFRPAAAEAQYFGRNKVHYDRLDFRLLETEHFDIHYYPEEEEATRHAARMAERWYARFSRVLGHTFTRRQPLVLYASHPHFSQTNLTPGSPGEGTGGFTEAARTRIAMPFAAGLGETDHVLGHEIAHAFQIDIAKRAGQNAFTLPGWFIEGMAEYLSLGPATPHTLMWVRDAARRDRLPTLEQLDDPGYFPYRFGHAFWSFVVERHGHEVMGRVLGSRARGGAIGRLEAVLGEESEAITRAWHASIEAPAGGLSPEPAPAGRGRMELAPALSPDGTRLLFLSERDRIAMDLFLADSSGTAAAEKIVSTAADPHFDSLQYIHSAGAWDAAGRRFAMTALRAGDPVLVVLDMADSSRRQEIPLPGVREVFNPTWSPDGSRIVLSALAGGLSDLWVYSFETRALRRLTSDAFADLHPAWSPDGRTIAFATDRFTSSIEALQFGALRVALFDLESMVIRPLTPGPDGGASFEGRAPLYGAPKQINPQWTPDGADVYFVSDPDGISNVYISSVHDGAARQVTDLDTGVSGITPTSPALTVASGSGTLAFTVFEGGRYAIRTAEGCGAAESSRCTPVASVLTPDGRQDAGEIPRLLADARFGLPDGSRFSTRQYDDRLQLESVSQPFVGATTGNTFGGPLRASVGVTFADLLRDRQLQTMIRVGTDLDDFAAQVAYTNRREQWNWGLTAGFVPARFYGARRALTRDDSRLTRETTSLRYLHQFGGVAGRFNMSRTRRVEMGAGVRRTGFTWQTLTRVTDLASRDEISRAIDEAPAGRPLYLADAQLAFVHDTAISGPTSPVLGERLRLEIEPAFGRRSFVDVRVDARKYLMPRRPLTIAARVEHVGRYGPGASDARLTPLVAGLPTLVRGYDVRSFVADQCGRTATSCAVMNELAGSRMAVANLEVRAPLLGLLTGDLDYGRLPIEALAYADAGLLWTRGPSGTIERHQFRSVGAGGRANLGGFVLELTAARPFDRASGWTVSFLLRPGW